MSDVIEINVENGEVTTRKYTNAEIKRRNDMQRPEDPLFDQTELLNYISNKQSALEKLQSLGLTEEEAKTVVGI